MKANEAPERIYVCDGVFPNHVDREGSPINTKRIDNHDIEYTRTDLFIESACEFLKDNGSHYIDILHGKVVLKKSIINDFNDYIKGKISGV